MIGTCLHINEGAIKKKIDSLYSFFLLLFFDYVYTIGRKSIAWIRLWLTYNSLTLLLATYLLRWLYYSSTYMSSAPTQRICMMTEPNKFRFAIWWLTYLIVHNNSIACVCACLCTVQLFVIIFSCDFYINDDDCQ